MGEIPLSLEELIDTYKKAGEDGAAAQELGRQQYRRCLLGQEYDPELEKQHYGAHSETLRRNVAKLSPLARKEYFKNLAKTTEVAAETRRKMLAGAQSVSSPVSPNTEPVTQGVVFSSPRLQQRLKVLPGMRVMGVAQ